MALAGVGQHFSRNFDQYTIMCVFGSVVGCVVLPLMAQSLESLIITAILFGVTVKTLNKASGGVGTGANREPQAEEQLQRKKDKKAKKPATKRHPQPQHQQSVVDSEALRQQRELDFIKREEQRELEKEQRCEEKRKKKAKKREERLQRREEEKIEKEKQEAILQQFRKEREARKKVKQSFSTPDLPLADIGQKPLRRERKHSTSSSGSSVSAHSSHTPMTAPHTAPKCRPPPRQPKRASSAPLMTATPPQAPAQEPSQFSPQLASTSACSTPPSHQSHAPLPMFHVLPILPFLTPQPQAPPPPPPPHFLLSGNTCMDSRPYQYPSYNWSTVQSMDADSANIVPQPLWLMNRSPGHASAESAHLQPEDGGNVNSNDGYNKAVDPPPLVTASGPAQGFYSFLNDQVSTDQPVTSSSNIWSPPSSSVPQDQVKDEWPDWFNSSTSQD